MIDPYLDTQYNARGSVPDYSVYPTLYRTLSDEAYRGLPHSKDVAYGPGAGETLDVFPAERDGSPVFVFIHGGYWRALSKEESAFTAPALHSAGATVVVLDYALAPAVGLSHIVDQVRRALGWVHREIAGYRGDPMRIVVGGSSAGGHLVGMLLADGWHERYGVPPAALVGAFPLSGLFDITPLLRTQVNDWMSLDEPTAVANSPLAQLPAAAPATRLVAGYGGLESDEFARQSQRYQQRWVELGGIGEVLAAPERNHFDVVVDLQVPGSPVHRAALNLLGLS